MSMAPDPNNYNEYSGFEQPGTPAYNGYQQWLAQPQTDARDWGFNFAYNQGLIANGPGFAANQNLRDQYNSQLGLLGQQAGSDTSYLRGSNANDLAKLGLNQQGIGIQQGANSRQTGFLNTMHGLAQQLFDVQGQRLDLQGNRIDLRGTEAWQQAGHDQRVARSDAIARGSNTSIGFNDTLSDIANQLINTGKELDIQKGELGADRSQLGINRQQETAKFNEDLASNTDAGRQLDLQAQGLGIDRNQLALDLQHGLDKIGLSNQVSVSDLLGKINSTNVQDAAMAQQILNGALQSSDFYAQYAPTPYSASQVGLGG